MEEYREKFKELDKTLQMAIAKTIIELGTTALKELKPVPVPSETSVEKVSAKTFNTAIEFCKNFTSDEIATLIADAVNE